MKADQHGSCPVQWGDRVDHKKFGFGTICAEPIPMSGPSDRDPWVVAAGWRVRVEWEDPARQPMDIAYQPDGPNVVLTKVSSSAAKGYAYWQNEWRKHFEPVQAASEETAAYLRQSFRTNPALSKAKLHELRRREDEAVKELVAFLDRDEAGEHL